MNALCANIGEEIRKASGKLKAIHNRMSIADLAVFELTSKDYKKLSASRVSENLQEIRKKIQEASK